MSKFVATPTKTAPTGNTAADRYRRMAAKPGGVPGRKKT
jgi:hypothetical protein